MAHGQTDYLFHHINYNINNIITQILRDKYMINCGKDILMAITISIGDISTCMIQCDVQKCTKIKIWYSSCISLLLHDVHFL